MAYPAAAFGPNCSSPVDPIECDCALAVMVHAAAEMRRANGRMAMCELSVLASFDFKLVSEVPEGAHESLKPRLSGC